jgi:molybdenum cofactor cytidylyltransferase
MTGAIVLAAGASSRMGGAGPKALLTLDGETFLARIVASLQHLGVAPVLVVTGAPHAALIEAALPAGATPVRNPDPGRGMASSIASGLEALGGGVASVLVWPVDTPAVRPKTVARLLEVAAGDPERFVQPTHGGRGGHPLLVPGSSRAALLSHLSIAPLRAFLQAEPARVLRLPVDDPGVLRDVDTPEDLGALLRHL